MNPEQQARQQIDAALQKCGWAVQDYKALDLSASQGIALREVPLKGGTCDYLLLVDRKPVGIVDAKPEGTTLSGVADQSAYKGDNLPELFQTSGRLPFGCGAPVTKNLFKSGETYTAHGYRAERIWAVITRNYNKELRP